LVNEVVDGSLDFGNLYDEADENENFNTSENREHNEDNNSFENNQNMEVVANSTTNEANSNIVLNVEPSTSRPLNNSIEQPCSQRNELQRKTSTSNIIRTNSSSKLTPAHLLEIDNSEQSNSQSTSINQSQISEKQAALAALQQSRIDPVTGLKKKGRLPKQIKEAMLALSQDVPRTSRPTLSVPTQGPRTRSRSNSKCGSHSSDGVVNRKKASNKTKSHTPRSGTQINTQLDSSSNIEDDGPANTFGL
jgi:hypothetical protein